MVNHPSTGARPTRSAVRTAAELMRVSEIRFRRLFETANDGILILDSETRQVTAVNPFMTRLLGYTREEFLGKELFEIGLLKDEEASQEAFTKLNDAGYIRYENLPLQTKSGELREVEFVSNLYDEDGSPVIQCNIRDITERKAAERMALERESALARSEKRYRTLFELGPVGVYCCDAAGIVREYNSRAAELWGRKPVLERCDERFCGAHKLYHSDGRSMPHHLSPVAAVLGGQIPFLCDEEVMIERPDGSRITVIVNIAPLRDADQRITGVINCFYDVTARKRMEATLRANEEQRRSSQVAIEEHAQKLELRVADRTRMLQETVTELEAFSYSISHDLRAPLRAMQSFAAALECDCGAQLGLQGKDYVRRIMTAAGRMDALIQDVLVYSRIARQDVPLERIELGSFVAGIVESYPHFDPALATIELVIPLGSVAANATALTQCFSNLIGNAIKFVRAGEKPHLRIWTEVDSDFRVKILFRDNGIGIEPAELEKIFGIFHQSDPTRPGTGIGLAVVRKAAERMGGTIRVESKLGAGSTFCLELKSALEI